MFFSALSRTQFLVVFIIGGLGTALGQTTAPSNASVYIISPKDGDTVPILLRCSLVCPAWGLRQPASTSQARVTTIC
jgi:hypothetical protein